MPLPSHKLREALFAETKNEMLEGEIEIDGAYFPGVVRPMNRVEDRKDRRTKENRQTAVASSSLCVSALAAP
ncbi:hypothetical protein [Mesorhizobium sp. WSM3224]|uniref:hypothetical protein n=1 Tax=Mesorhizobium sp. WSM3224 TaxID=1040986 RepID=UPI000429D181|nr:hypothetical protein [Mesorhizobium sp. WSM3224]